VIHYLRQHYMTQPHEVSIETLALCNAACTFCPYPTLPRKGAELSMDLITLLIGQMREWTQSFFVSPFKVNEPFLDPRLPEICAGVESELPRARLRLFTNGQPLTLRHIEWVAKLKRVEHLWVSLNSTDPAEYEQLMKCKFSIVLRNLDALHAAVAKKEFSHAVVLSRVLQGGTMGQVLGDADCQFHRDVLERWPLFQTHLIKRDSWLGYVPPGDTRVPRSPCARWFELSITAEGKAVLCCMDGKGEYVQGDVTQQSLLGIYNSPFLRKCRESSVRDGIEPCQTCSY
jgi:hypothetical protein